MNKIKVMTIFGTRPEAIKMAPLVKELEKREEIESIVCVTAQHRQMLDQVLDTFNITPDYDLNIMKQGQTLVDITTRALQSLSEVISKVKPNIVLVHGDTTTTLSGSLAAFYNQVSVGHVEAGLRTYDKYSPFPEEVNRQVTGVIADMHFAPTQVSKNNLLKEGKKEETIYVTGNTAIDALKTTVKDEYYHPIFDKIGNDKMILLTAHRRENLGEPMKNMFRAIKRIVEEFDDIQVVYPVHLNPLVRQAADEVLGDNSKVHLIEPLEVLDFHNFLNKSHIIMTDSGGIQEEAPSLGKPVLVLRDTTEMTLYSFDKYKSKKSNYNPKIYITNVVYISFFCIIQIYLKVERRTMYLNNYFSKHTTNNLKAVAIILVILGHLGFINKSGAWGVGIFLLLSGYGLTQSYIKSGIIGFFKKRLLAVILPYSIVMIIWIFVDYILGNKYRILTIGTSLLGLNFKSVIDVTMWYISFLILWYIAFFCIFKLIKNNYFKIITMFIFSYIVYYNLYELFDQNVGVRLYTLLFPIGVFLGFLFSKELNISESMLKSILGHLIIFSFILFEISLNRSYDYRYYTISIIMFSIMIISIFMFMNDFESKILSFIGNISFELYLFEGVFINKYNFIFKFINNKFWATLIYFILIIILSYIYHRIVKKINKYLK